MPEDSGERASSEYNDEYGQHDISPNNCWLSRPELSFLSMATKI
jgi:hypothetical protein